MEFELYSAIWEAISKLLENPFIRVISTIVTPILAILAFVWNRRDRKQLIIKSTELGRLENEVENAHASIREKQSELELAGSEIQRRGQAIQKLEDDLRRITDNTNALWNLRPAPSFDHLRANLWDRSGARIITIGNLKGGVGKTTLAANFAAYISEL